MLKSNFLFLIRAVSNNSLRRYDNNNDALLLRRAFIVVILNEIDAQHKCFKFFTIYHLFIGFL